MAFSETPAGVPPTKRLLHGTNQDRARAAGSSTRNQHLGYVKSWNDSTGCHFGARRRREPGIHDHWPWLWIPGSLAALGPRNDCQIQHN